MKLSARALAAVILVGPIGVSGCEPSAAGESNDQIARVRERMHVKLAAAKAIQLAIALGDLDRARAEARRLANESDPEWAPAWRPYLADIQYRAQQIAASEDPVTAAKAVAQLGGSCARCHDANHAKITFTPEKAPAPGSRLSTQMASHQWAAARLWEGLIGNSNQLWLTGATSLSGADIPITAESGKLGIADDAARTKLLATRASKLGTSGERAEIYGELLATCAHCHAKIRDVQLGEPSGTAGARE